MSPAEGVSPEATAGGLTVGAKGIPEATVARLPGYLRALNHLSDNGVATVSSGDLADEAGVNPAQLRKDLSHLGSYGTRGVGYSVEYLRFQIGREIGSTVDWPVIIIGVGNLGTALAKNADFGSRGFRVVALVDTSSDLVGTELDGLLIEHQDDLTRTVRDSGARIAVITTPPGSAQAVCDELVSCGITSILNFAATVLTAPDDVTVRKVDLGQELQILAYHEQRKLDGSWPAEMADGAWTPPVHDQARLAGSTTISVPEREAP